MKNKVRSILMGLLAVLACYMFIVVPFMLSGKAFIVGYDANQQYQAFFSEFVFRLKEVISSRQLPFYSWNEFLGNNFFTSRLFYYMNIFDYVLVPFGNLSYGTVSAISVLLKAFVSFGCFYAYGDYRKYKKNTLLLLSIVYAFSSYFVSNIKNSFFWLHILLHLFIFLRLNTISIKIKKDGCLCLLLH